MLDSIKTKHPSIKTIRGALKDVLSNFDLFERLLGHIQHASKHRRRPKFQPKNINGNLVRYPNVLTVSLFDDIYLNFFVFDAF